MKIKLVIKKIKLLLSKSVMNELNSPQPIFFSCEIQTFHIVLLLFNIQIQNIKLKILTYILCCEDNYFHHLNYKVD